MNRLLTLPPILLALLCTSALACPVKPGTMLAGSFKTLPGFTPICNEDIKASIHAMKRMVQSTHHVNYIETYVLTGSVPVAVDKIGTKIESYGYTYSTSQQGEDGANMDIYTNPAGLTMVVMVKRSTERMFVLYIAKLTPI